MTELDTLNTPLLDDLIDNMDLSNNICKICFDILENQEILNLPLCNHSFHYICLLKKKFYKNSTCPSCKTYYKEMNLICLGYTKSIIKVKIDGPCYQLYQSYYIDNEMKGLAVLYGWYRTIFKPFILKIKFMKGFRSLSSSYVSYVDKHNPQAISKSDFKKLPLYLRIFKHTITFRLKVSKKEILKLETIPISGKNMNIGIVKVILVDGMKSEDMSGIVELHEFGRSLPLQFSSKFNKFEMLMMEFD